MTIIGRRGPEKLSDWPKVTEPLLRFVLVDARGSQASAFPVSPPWTNQKGQGSLETT